MESSKISALVGFVRVVTCDAMGPGAGCSVGGNSCVKVRVITVNRQ